MERRDTALCWKASSLPPRLRIGLYPDPKNASVRGFPDRKIPEREKLTSLAQDQINQPPRRRRKGWLSMSAVSDSALAFFPCMPNPQDKN